MIGKEANRILLVGVHKLLTEFSPRDTYNNTNIMITHSQSKFLEILGYSLSDLPMPLEQLFPTWSRRTYNNLERVLLRCRPATYVVDLLSATGDVCSAHISMVVYPGNPQQEWYHHTDNDEARTSKSTRTLSNANLIVSAEDAAASPPGPVLFAIFTIRGARRLGTSIELEIEPNPLESQDTVLQQLGKPIIAADGASSSSILPENHFNTT